MNRTRIASLVGAAALAVSVTAAVGLPAQAKSSDSAKAGTCSATSTLKLKASDHKKGIKVKAKVNSDVAGETWVYSISDNAVLVTAGEATTDEDGNFKVKTTIADLEGSDTIDFTATDSVTGETCTGEVVVG